SGARAISRSTAGVTSSWVRMIILFSFGGVLPSRTLAPVEFPPNRRKVLPLPPRLREGRGGDFGTAVPVVAHPELRAATPEDGRGRNPEEVPCPLLQVHPPPLPHRSMRARPWSSSTLKPASSTSGCGHRRMRPPSGRGSATPTPRPAASLRAAGSAPTR